jgi:hypothetical protein
LAPLPGKRGVYAYGYLPPRLFEIVRDGFVALLENRRAKLVR